MTRQTENKQKCNHTPSVGDQDIEVCTDRCQGAGNKNNSR